MVLHLAEQVTECSNDIGRKQQLLNSFLTQELIKREIYQRKRADNYPLPNSPKFFAIIY